MCRACFVMALAVLAGVVALPAVAEEPKPAAKENFDARSPIDNWKPVAEKDGWRTVQKGDVRFILDAKFGREGTIGVGGYRTGSESTNVLYWQVKLDAGADTLSFYAMIPEKGTGFDIITQADKYAGYVRVGHGAGIALKFAQDKAHVALVSPEAFQRSRWYRVELQHDFEKLQQRARVDGGAWSSWYPFMESTQNATTAVQFYCGVTAEGDASFCMDDLAVYKLGAEGGAR
ncbi:MAG: hypothetical protein V2A58_10375 [Planctomycetota bacterium]